MERNNGMNNYQKVFYHSAAGDFYEYVKWHDPAFFVLFQYSSIHSVLCQQIANQFSVESTSCLKSQLLLVLCTVLHRCVQGIFALVHERFWKHFQIVELPSELIE